MNFKELDRLIHSNIKRITLTSDVVLEESEELIYKNGIEIDLDGLIIDGNGHVIDAKNKVRIFNIRARLQVIITNVTFKNGLHTQGGAINNYSKFLTLGCCIFEDNSAFEGGAIYNHAFIKATNCNFKNNNSKYCTDIYNWDTLILRECNFINSKRNIIFNLNDVKTVECNFESHHIIQNNYMDINDTDNESSKQSSNFIDDINEFIDESLDSISNYNNIVSDIQKSREQDYSNKNTDDAMSFSELKNLLSNNKMVFLNCDVVFNQDDGKLKDGISFIGSDFTKTDESHVILDDDLVIDGKGHTIDAKGLARIFIILNKDVTVTFRDISFKNAYFPKVEGDEFFHNGGGAVYNEGNCRFEFCEFINNRVSLSGGAIYNYKGEMTFFECIFDKNHSDGYAGVILNNMGDLDFINCIFKRNSSKQAGAVLCDYLGKLNFKTSCFKDNSTEFTGILALAYNVSFDFDGSLFLDNSVAKGDYIYNTSFF